MRGLLTFTSCLLLGACSSAEDRKRAELLDEVERLVQLPEGAKRLDQYVRFYSHDEQGKIVGRYIIYFTERRPRTDEQCEELSIDMASRMVPCPTFPSLFQGAKAGERRWFEDYRAMPYIFDGGCDVIEVLFDPATMTVEYASCHGEV